MSKCITCKSESINQMSTEEPISYKGKYTQVPMAYSVCNNCDREFVSKKQIMANDSLVRDAKKYQDG